MKLNWETLWVITLLKSAKRVCIIGHFFLGIPLQITYADSNRNYSTTGHAGHHLLHDMLITEAYCLREFFGI